MRIRTLATTLAFAISLPVLASSTLFSGYEDVRQSLLKGSLEEVKKNASALAAEASKAKQESLAKHATTLADSTDMKKARAAFAPVSEEMIRVRSTAKGDRPAIYHCTMIRKAWLQPKGKVGNPYDASMPMCGELKEE